MDIHWYPGHMARAKRQLKERLAHVDVVVELADARIPKSSRNPDLAALIGAKPSLLVLTKADLADQDATAGWTGYYREHGARVVAVDLLSGKGVELVVPGLRALAEQKMAAVEAKGMQRREIRAMVVGIPNVGKSSLINRLVGKAGARVEDRPGVTRGQQWIRVPGRLELLDTPGLLWPKFGDPRVAFRLAVTGAVKERLLDDTALALHLLKWLQAEYPGRLSERYRLEKRPDAAAALEAIGKVRGCLLKGGRVDIEKAATIVLQEFRQGKLGRFTLDRMEEDLS